MSTTPAADACPLCAASPADEGSHILWQDEALRVVLIDDPIIPGFTRVIWQAHIGEMTDLAGDSRARLMRAVWLVEDALRGVLHPDKINLASLGNQVPHVHWHIIPRWRDDPFFPGSVWSPATDDPQRLAAWTLRQNRLRARVGAYRQALISAMSACG